MIGLSYYKYVTKLVKKIKLNTTRILRMLVVFNIIFFTRFVTNVTSRKTKITPKLNFELGFPFIFVLAVLIRYLWLNISMCKLFERPNKYAKLIIYYKYLWKFIELTCLNKTELQVYNKVSVYA